MRNKSFELAKIQPNEKVLMVGAGTGKDLESIPKGAKITAIDITQAMISRLKKRADILGLTVDAQMMDGQNMTFSDESFDVVILHFVLAVVPNPELLLKEARRVLKKQNGRILVLNRVADDESSNGLLRKIFSSLVEVAITNLNFKFTPTARAAGLEISHVEAVGEDKNFKVFVLKLPSSSPFSS
jgi:ubiquinone/menaquinone biosynthesis C-methylase UbiE